MQHMREAEGAEDAETVQIAEGAEGQRRAEKNVSCSPCPAPLWGRTIRVGSAGGPRVARLGSSEAGTPPASVRDTLRAPPPLSDLCDLYRPCRLCFLCAPGIDAKHQASRVSFSKRTHRQPVDQCFVRRERIRGQP